MADLVTNDPEIAAIIAKETERQSLGLNLIASENIVSCSVMAAQGSILTNKYAEGYPSRRYYGGCDFVDQAENLAITRAKKLFGTNYANVQPHSGSQANMAVYFALLNPGPMAAISPMGPEPVFRAGCMIFPIMGCPLTRKLLIWTRWRIWQRPFGPS